MKLSFLDWCRINWKFLLGVSVPIFLILIGKKINVKQIWDQAKKDKQKEIDIINKAHKTEEELKEEAIKDYVTDIKNALVAHGEAIEDLNKKTEEDKKKIIDSGAEGATDAINDRFDLD